MRDEPPKLLAYGISGRGAAALGIWYAIAFLWEYVN
jgi:hypothetical protein